MLITGVGSHVGTLLAARLEEDPEVEHIVGIDTRRPARTLSRTEWIDADVTELRPAGAEGQRAQAAPEPASRAA